MFNPSENSTDARITELVEEMLNGMKEADKKKMLRELELQMALTEVQSLKGSVKKNALKSQDFVNIVRRVRKQHGWNIA